jgi:hypothetical protein
MIANELNKICQRYDATAISLVTYSPKTLIMLKLLGNSDL